MWHRISERWNRFFFLPDRPENLAICRILFFGGLLLLHFPIDYHAWGRVDDSFWLPEQCWPFEFFAVPRLSAGTLAVLGPAWKISLLLCCVGLAYRFASWVALIGGLYLLGLPHCLGNLSHGDAAAAITLGIMAFAKASDALSLDRILFRRSVTRQSFEYRWPVRSVWLLLATVFFAAGYSKMSITGLPWILTDNMNYIFIEHQFPAEHPEALIGLGGWLASLPVIPQLIALTTIILELGYPLALFSVWARRTIVPAMVMAVIGFRVLLGPSFFPLILLHVFWLRLYPEPEVEPQSRDASQQAARVDSESTVHGGLVSD